MFVATDFSTYTLTEPQTLKNNSRDDGRKARHSSKYIGFVSPRFFMSLI